MSVVTVASAFGEGDLDALREIANVGVGNAAGALAQMTGRRIGLTVPRVRWLPLREIPQALGGAEVPVVALFLRTFGDLRANILIVLTEEDAATLVRLVGAGPLRSGEQPGEMEASALQEIGNILASSYLNAIGKLLGLTLFPSVPGLAFDMAGAAADYLLIELSEAGDEAIVMETEFREPVRREFAGRFFVLPDTGSLQALLRAILHLRLAGRSAG